jgi:hypothetical protein
VNSDPRNCSNLLTTPPYAPTINYNLLLSQRNLPAIDFFSGLLVERPRERFWVFERRSSPLSQVDLVSSSPSAAIDRHSQDSRQFPPLLPLRGHPEKREPLRVGRDARAAAPPHR